MISCSISRKRIDASLLIPSKSGIKGEETLAFNLVENKNGPDQYGNHGFLSQKGSKEQNEKMKAQNKFGPIIGSWKDWSRDSTSHRTPRRPSPPKQETNPAAPLKDEDPDTLPF